MPNRLGHELTPWGRLTVDAAFSGTILGLTLGLDWFARKKIGRGVVRERLHHVLTWASIIAGFLAQVVSFEPAGIIAERIEYVSIESKFFVICTQIVYQRIGKRFLQLYRRPGSFLQLNPWTKHIRGFSHSGVFRRLQDVLLPFAFRHRTFLASCQLEKLLPVKIVD